MRWKAACRTYTVGNIDLSGTGNGDVVNGVTLATGDRVLALAQTDPSENGIYEVWETGCLRAPDADDAGDWSSTWQVYAGNRLYQWSLPGTFTLGTSNVTITHVIPPASVSGDPLIAPTVIDQGLVTDAGGVIERLRRGTTAQVAAVTPSAGQLILDSQNNILRIGDGATPGGLPFSGIRNLPRNAMFLTAILRNTGSGWDVLSDAYHEALGDITVSEDTAKITLSFGQSYSFIHAVTATPDETFAQAGIFCGSSVGLTSCEVYLYQNRLNHGLITYDGAQWQIAQNNGITGVAWASNKLTVSHGQFNSLGGTHVPQVSMRGNGCLAACDAVGAATSEIIFTDFSGAQLTSPSTAMRVYFSAHGGGVLNPVTCVNALANIWFFALVSKA